MTKINKLVMHGFKSFAKRTELQFTDGFNCVVGPNGAGKSNLIDALCFVLGKTSAKSLRAEKSSNLIYNGGKSKQPAKNAEVSIYFDNSQKIFPTDDAYVITDENDPSNQRGLEDIHTGNLKFLKIWNANNVTPNQEKIFTIGYLKFDLSNVGGINISDANLLLKTRIINATQPRQIDLFFVPNSSWDELDIAYYNKPGLVSDQVIASTTISEINKWYSWDVTDIIKQTSGTQVSFALVNRLFEDKTEEQFIFYSKEADDPENVPFLEIEYTGAVPPTLLQSTQGNETDYTLAAIVGGLVAAAVGIGIFFTLVLRKKGSKQLTTQQATTTISEKTRTDSPEQKLSPEKKCKLCDKPLSKEFKVCPYCGYKI